MCILFLPAAKYIKCEQCGNPKVSRIQTLTFKFGQQIKRWAIRFSCQLLKHIFIKFRHLVRNSLFCSIRTAFEIKPRFCFYLIVSLNPVSFYFPLQGNKCVFSLCRGCCKKKAYKEVADCPSKCVRTHTHSLMRCCVLILCSGYDFCWFIDTKTPRVYYRHMLRH